MCHSGASTPDLCIDLPPCLADRATCSSQIILQYLCPHPGLSGVESLSLTSKIPMKRINQSIINLIIRVIKFGTSQSVCALYSVILVCKKLCNSYRQEKSVFAWKLKKGRGNVVIWENRKSAIEGWHRSRMLRVNSSCDFHHVLLLLSYMLPTAS